MIIDYATQYIGDYNNPRTGNPVLNQPGLNGMTEGFCGHCSVVISVFFTSECPCEAPGRQGEKAFDRGGAWIDCVACYEGIHDLYGMYGCLW